MTNTPTTPSRTWSDVDREPNGLRARALRAVRLDRASKRALHSNRIDTLVAVASGRRVIDLGCVGHSAERVGTDGWLHARIAASAKQCLGVDIHAEGVAEMRRQGFDARCHDITSDPAPLLTDGPFDVIIAGELIEHIDDLGTLIRFAQQVLEPGGTLALTTPNPYAPWRVRAGQLGLITDNTDHICLIHPSGIAELCDRAGVSLDAAWTTETKDRAPGSIHESLWQLFRSTPLRSPRPSNWARALNRNWLSPFEVILHRRRTRRGWSGETAIYLIKMEPPYEPTEAELAGFAFGTGKFTPLTNR